MFDYVLSDSFPMYSQRKKYSSDYLSGTDFYTPLNPVALLIYQGTLRCNCIRNKSNLNQIVQVEKTIDFIKKFPEVYLNYNVLSYF